MDKIAFRKRIYIFRATKYTTKYNYWYLYVNGIQNKDFYIEQEIGIGAHYFLIIYFSNRRIVPNIPNSHILPAYIHNLIFDNLYAAKQAVLKLVYHGQDFV